MKLTAMLLMMLTGTCAAVPDATQSAPATADGVTLRAERSGADVRLILTNGSAGPVGYNLCSSRLMMRSGSSWTNVPTGLICTMEIRRLEAGATTDFQHTLPEGAVPGEYRYQTRVEIPLGGSGTDVSSNPFTAG